MKVGVQKYGVSFMVDQVRAQCHKAPAKLVEYEQRNAGARLGAMIAKDFEFRTENLPNAYVDLHTLEVVVVKPKHYNELLRKADAWDALQ